jgi:hypothetical protein
MRSLATDIILSKFQLPLDDHRKMKNNGLLLCSKRFGPFKWRSAHRHNNMVDLLNDLMGGMPVKPNEDIEMTSQAIKKD